MRGWRWGRTGAALALAWAIGAGGAGGCAAGPGRGAGAPADGAGSAGAVPSPAAAPEALGEPVEPVIQIRDFPAAAVVTVVAWSPEDAAYGLRAQVNRSGELVGTQRLGDHRLFVSTTRAEVMGGFGRVWVVPVPPGPVLLHGRPVVDEQACADADACAPRTIVEVQMPDDLLRQHRDSMVVTFSGGRYQDWSLVLDGALIDAYLRTVDSVTAARRGA